MQAGRFFDGEEHGFYGERDFWAPEFHKYNGTCYMFVSGKSEWKHGGSRFDFDGGHAMLFEKLDEAKMISLHSPNKVNLEGAAFHPW